MAVIKIILIGMKGCGKSTVGILLAKRLNIPFIELDDELEKMHFQDKKEKFSYREIYQKYGKEYFRKLETSVLKILAQESKNKSYVLACGGGTPLNLGNQKLLIKLGKIIYLKPGDHELYKRVISHGIPAFFQYSDNPKKSFKELLIFRDPVYKKMTDMVLDCHEKNPGEIVNMILHLIE